MIASSHWLIGWVRPLLVLLVLLVLDRLPVSLFPFELWMVSKPLQIHVTSRPALVLPFQSSIETDLPIRWLVMTSSNKPFESSAVHLPNLPFNLKYQILTKHLEVCTGTSLILDLLLKKFFSLIYWIKLLVMTSFNKPFESNAVHLPNLPFKLKYQILTKHLEVCTGTSLTLDLLLKIFIFWFINLID